MDFMSEEVSFLRRPAHTEAEDWIVYHPEITPPALMLYMRLRGAVMDPSSSAEDWKKTSRFTMEQMRSLLPASKPRAGNDDPRACIRTVRMNLSHLVAIGALRRIELKGSQIPVYDFPMYPPEGYEGPMWGGSVAQKIRTETPSSEPKASITDSDMRGGNQMPGRQSNAGVGASGGNQMPGGGNQMPGSEAVTCGDGGPKKLFKKNPPPQEEAADQPQEDEEEPRNDRTNRRAEIERAERVLSALLRGWSVDIQGSSRLKALRSLITLLGDAWTEPQIGGLFVNTDWDSVRMPDRFILDKLMKSVGTRGVPMPEEEKATAIAALEDELAMQVREIGSCDSCDDNGFVDGVWHEHGRKGIKMDIWELENEDELKAYREA